MRNHRAALRYTSAMDNSQQKPAKPRQPSKLDDHPLTPLADFQGRMREVLTVTPEEVQRRETEHQRQQAEKRKNKKAA